MLDQMDGTMFLEWMLFSERYPFGEERADMRAGIIASTMANLWSKKKYKPQDFMISAQLKGKRRKTVEEMKAVLMMASDAARFAAQGKAARGTVGS